MHFIKRHWISEVNCFFFAVLHCCFGVLSEQGCLVAWIQSAAGGSVRIRGCDFVFAEPVIKSEDHRVGLSQFLPKKSPTSVTEMFGALQCCNFGSGVLFVG